MPVTIVGSGRRRARALVAQLARFSAVGLVGFGVDFTVFNLLRTTVFDTELVAAGPLYSKIAGAALAILVNWIGNRLWTFGANRRTNALREGAEFALVSVVGLGIGLGCLWLGHYVLGHTSVMADNVSNVVGLGLGTVFRFALYRFWVFAPGRRTGGNPAAERAAGLPRPGHGLVGEG